MSVKTDIQEGRLVAVLNNKNKPEFYRKKKNGRWYRVPDAKSTKTLYRVSEEKIMKRIVDTREKAVIKENTIILMPIWKKIVSLPKFIITLIISSKEMQFKSRLKYIYLSIKIVFRSGKNDSDY